MAEIERCVRSIETDGLLWGVCELASLYLLTCIAIIIKVKVKERIAVSGIPSHSYGTSLAIWDHTVLPATRHKRTCPAFTPASRPVLDLPTPEGWKAELT